MASKPNEPQGSPEASLVRLNKFLADQGVASRRKCDELIEAGQVSLDGLPVTVLGTKIDPYTQTVEINGIVLKPEGLRRRYYLLNKPPGVLCTNDEREMRQRAIDLITDKSKGRIYTVGRLDEDSEGLILLTNDGEFAHRIAHPRHGVEKTYKVTVKGRIEIDAVDRVRRGVFLSDGRTGAVRVRIDRRAQTWSTLTVTLHEGRNREVRRIFARVGYDVISLRRTHIGQLSDHRLKRGEWRPLKQAEMKALLSETHDDAEGMASRREAGSRIGSRPGGNRRQAAAQRSGSRGSSSRGSGPGGFGSRGSGPGGSGPRGKGSREGGRVGAGAGAGTRDSSWDGNRKQDERWGESSPFGSNRGGGNFGAASPSTGPSKGPLGGSSDRSGRDEGRERRSWGRGSKEAGADRRGGMAQGASGSGRETYPPRGGSSRRETFAPKGHGSRRDERKGGSRWGEGSGASSERGFDRGRGDSSQRSGKKRDTHSKGGGGGRYGSRPAGPRSGDARSGSKSGSKNRRS